MHSHHYALSVLSRTLDSSGNVVEPVTLAQAKLYCRVDQGVEDDLFNDLITGAREYAEAFTQRALITQTLLQALDAFGPDPLESERFFAFAPPLSMVLRLARSPVSSFTQIQYIDPAGNTQTLDPTLYQTDLISEPARVTPIWGKIWPVTRPFQPNAAQLTFVAGYGADGTFVPQGIKMAMRVWIADRYYNRESAKSLAAIDALLWPYRVARGF